MSLAQISDILVRLNILPFDENKGERLVAEYVPAVQKILEEKNLIVHDDGADVIPVKLDTDTAPMPPVMWRSSVGNQTYAAADLAAVDTEADFTVAFTAALDIAHADIFTVAADCLTR